MSKSVDTSLHGRETRELTNLAFRRGMVSPSTWIEPGTSEVKGGDLNIPG